MSFIKNHINDRRYISFRFPNNDVIATAKDEEGGDIIWSLRNSLPNLAQYLRQGQGYVLPHTLLAKDLDLYVRNMAKGTFFGDSFQP